MTWLSRNRPSFVAVDTAVQWAVYSITSSALASIVCGTLIPSI
jgi:hypothetical protein